MIICKKCGADNQLGRVFCTSCGTKLDLTAMTTESVADSQKVSWIGLHWPKFVIGLVVIVLAVCSLALWPDAGLIGEKGTLVGGRRVEGQMDGVAAMKVGTRVGPVFTEQDLNGYLENIFIKNAKISSMSVSVKKGLLTVKMVNVFFRATISKYQIPLAFTYELKCLPSGGRLLIGEAKMGHLALVGSAKKIAVNALLKALATDKLWAGLSGVDEIKCEDGKLSLVVSKK